MIIIYSLLYHHNFQLYKLHIIVFEQIESALKKNRQR